MYGVLGGGEVPSRLRATSLRGGESYFSFQRPQGGTCDAARTVARLCRMNGGGCAWYRVTRGRSGGGGRTLTTPIHRYTIGNGLVANHRHTVPAAAAPAGAAITTTAITATGAPLPPSPSRSRFPGGSSSICRADVGTTWRVFRMVS